ncbi:cytochrome c-552 class I [Ameyamaea chiangmaiensis NBRC 103196]|uniref:Cytochrome c n=1 Tax=Ameyamaea chiangmaiensis TaxID=442969 RepID=A0A850P775_9PROT|nr:cytochrome c [Ameyamaea chiangmaiensis]MBS4073577.1 cytochrome c [Ameyamaea chiangmaiensis]NVN40457.1 cytochrome c [Ameyamaea chiangmaiensis]GBQ69195.1 cytochrome c-552 class I [Ameyamaea chiangmaiensis NBRC 103196]
MKSIALAAAVTFATVPAAMAAPDGAALYGSNCGICHQGGAVGVPGQFPPLKGRLDKIAASPAGKTYITHVLVNGLSGSIQASGTTYVGYMPSFKALPDDQIAAILTYVASLGDTKPAPTFEASDIAAARATPMAGSAVAAERKGLGALIP